MAVARNLAHRITTWITSRPKLDMDESVTWFLLVFVYALGVNGGEPSIEFSGIRPQLSLPQLNLAMMFACLVISSMILIEPLLPYRMRIKAKDLRCSNVYKYVRGWSMFVAFTLGWLGGFTLIISTFPELSWMIMLIFFMGFGISMMLLVRIPLAFRSGRNLPTRKRLS